MANYRMYFYIILERTIPPTRLCKETSSLVDEAYAATGQAGASMNTMVDLQANKANLLKQGCPILFLEINLTAGFRSNPDPTYLSVIIKCS